MEVVASLSQGRTAAAQCGLFTYKSVPVIFEPPCILNLVNHKDYKLHPHVQDAIMWIGSRATVILWGQSLSSPKPIIYSSICLSRNAHPSYHVQVTVQSRTDASKHNIEYLL